MLLDNVIEETRDCQHKDNRDPIDGIFDQGPIKHASSPYDRRELGVAAPRSRGCSRLIASDGEDHPEHGETDCRHENDRHHIGDVPRQNRLFHCDRPNPYTDYMRTLRTESRSLKVPKISSLGGTGENCVTWSLPTSYHNE